MPKSVGIGCQYLASARSGRICNTTHTHTHFTFALFVGPSPSHPSQALGKLEDAERAARQAVSLFQGALGDGHPNSALATNTLGLVLLGQGHAADAVALLEAAMTVRSTPGW